MPSVVFPNNGRGQSEWQKWDKSSVTIPYFCNEYEPERPRLRCARRNPDGVAAKNLCRRCIAGYLYDFSVAAQDVSRVTEVRH